MSIDLKIGDTVAIPTPQKLNLDDIDDHDMLWRAIAGIPPEFPVELVVVTADNIEEVRRELKGQSNAA